MSYWKDAKKEDLSLSDDKSEIDILYGTDYNGNNYISVKVEDIIDLLGEII